MSLLWLTEDYLLVVTAYKSRFLAKLLVGSRATNMVGPLYIMFTAKIRAILCYSKSILQPSFNFRLRRNFNPGFNNYNNKIKTINFLLILR